MTTVNKFLGAVFTHGQGFVLTFQEEEINKGDLGPSEVTGKTQTKFHCPLF